ncbi:MAG: hemolysin III family protein [Acidobacteria bacterium]|nr:hemolysin III family protein [Acidobacteriota bacterium]
MPDARRPTPDARRRRPPADLPTLRVNQYVEAVTDDETAALEVLKPKLRGWLHAGMFPVSAAAGIVLIALAGSREARIATALFATTGTLLFGTSALFHRGSWSPRVHGVLRRLDHSNIFLIIAGTYTPLAVLALPDNKGRVLLWIAWVGALVGVAFSVLWIGAPRWLYTPVYVALGWVAVFYIPDLVNGAGVAVVVLVVIGGALYSIGALIYGTKHPNPSPTWFGFHEVFHALTIAAFIVHYVAVSLTVYS